MDNAESIKEYLTTVIKMLVENHDAIVVESSKDDMGVLFTIKVAENEWGKVIGKQGETVRAIRTLTTAIGFMREMRATVKLLAPEKGRSN